MTLQIKFSHDYPKLHGQKQGELIAVRVIEANEINQFLRDYDTKYFVSGNYDYYQLPKEGRMLQLFFIGNYRIPFCTIRRWTPQKDQYYRVNLNKIFNINITERGDSQ